MIWWLHQTGAGPHVPKGRRKGRLSVCPRRAQFGKQLTRGLSEVQFFSCLLEMWSMGTGFQHLVRGEPSLVSEWWLSIVAVASTSERRNRRVRRRRSLARFRLFAIQNYVKGFDAGPPKIRAGSLSFCLFSRFLVVLPGLPAGSAALPALF